MGAVFTGLFSLLYFANSAVAGVYGSDDRYATHEIQDSAILGNAYVSAALVERAKLLPFSLPDGSGYLVQLTGLNVFTGPGSRVCSNTKFFDTLALSQCSGVLVGPSTIISAGHCFQSAVDPKHSANSLGAWVWVFDYKVTPGQKTIFIPKSSVYDIGYSSMADLTGQYDFALFKLKNPVPREPALFSLAAAEVAFGEEHYMVGHPTGAPQTVSLRGFRVKVPRSLNQSEIFYSNLDAFSGNSGSPVFSSTSHNIVGILTRGKNDYEYNATQKCYFIDPCEDTGCKLKKVDGEFIPPAETVFKINNANGLLAKVYEYEFRNEVEYAVEHRFDRYLKHVFRYMDSISYETYMRSTQGNNILSLLIQVGAESLVDQVFSSPRLLKLSMLAGKDIAAVVYRRLPERFVDLIRQFPNANYYDPVTRGHLIFNAVLEQKTAVIEAFIHNQVPSQLSESDRLKLKTMLTQKGYTYAI